MEFRADALERAARIRMVVMDVDGTMTDGRIYIGPEGEAIKEFSVKDGMGITMLHKAGVKTAIITGRKSEIVEHRAAELKIDSVWQGIKDKREAWQKIKEELQELEQAVKEGKQRHIEEELGDVLFSVVNLSRFYKVDSELALLACCKKFRQRFEYVEGQVNAQGGDWSSFSLEQLDAYWNEAKNTITD